MTKLKGTIQLGEGYNKTKAVFNGNIDNLEVKSVSIKDSTAKDVLLGNGTTLPLFNKSNTINSQYLPSYVDDVIEAPSQNDFPVVGESGKIYLDLSTNSTYRWSGSTYVLITSGDMETTINDIVNQIQEVESNITAIQNTLDFDKFKEYDTEYLTFTALEDSTVGYEMPMWASDDELPVLDLQYSYDGITWTNFDGTTLSITKGSFVQFKGDNTEFHRNIGTFIINGKVDASGNVMSIVYADNFIGKIDFPNDKFNLSNLFGYYCSGLYSAHNLILPALNLTYQCYYEMFTECTSLISTPELPATTLQEECYCGMFSACTSLTTAPQLPSLKLASYCYSGMFYNCNSLVSTPELPATMLATSCYSGMFNKCSSLVNAPSLPAIVLANSCYEEMFYECTALLNTPELPATILADKCYNMMFYGCTSLTNICELPAKKLENSCYQGMFGMCTSLTEIPELHAKTLVYNCYTGMFQGCDNVTYAKMLCDMPSTDEQTWACSGMFSAPSGTIVLSSVAQSHPDIVPRGWKVINYYVNNEYISELKDKINSSNKTIQSNTEEIDILKNRIISTTYSELKDAVTNSTLTTGQYYRITDYVTTCNGTSAKVTDASTIDPENPVDGQSRSAGHQFDIIVRALSPNQLDENAVVVCNASETYYDSTFNGTVIKYSIENKYWSTEDGKGTIYYMKDHNDNECSYDFTNIEYYYAEDTTWYLTFTDKIDSRIYQNSIINEQDILPSVLIIATSTDKQIFNNKISGNINNCILKCDQLIQNIIRGNITNFIITAQYIRYNNFSGSVVDSRLTGPYADSNIFSGDLARINLQASSAIKSNVLKNTSDVNIEAVNLLENNINATVGLNVTNAAYFSVNEISANNVTFTILPSGKRQVQLNTIKGCQNISITASEIVNNVFWYAEIINVQGSNSTHAFSINTFYSNVTNITITNCKMLGTTIYENSNNLTFESNSSGCPAYITVGKTVTYCTFTGLMQQLHVEDGCRYLNFTMATTSAPLNYYIYNLRGKSDAQRLTLPLQGDNHLKEIYRDKSGRIFHVWEDNLVKKGYYLNDNTDTEWKEIPTSKEPVEVSTIPDAVTTALSVATLDLTTRTTIATIATDETLAFTQVPDIQGEYRLVVVNSSEEDITITMPTEENYQCLCGATLTILAQTNIELIINVTDTLIYIRKG